MAGMINSFTQRSQKSDWDRNSAFSLVELLVVIGIVAVLAALLLPVLNRAKASGLSAACMGNQKQLQICFAEYVNDNGQFPSNNLVVVIGYGAILGSSWAPGDVDAFGETTNLQYGALYPYNKSLGIYRCPADRTLISSTNSNGTAPRTRSYKMNLWLNCISEPYGYQRESELSSCGKSVSDFFVFIDMHSEGIHDPAFGIYQEEDWWRFNLWIDLPADRHSQGANLSFLDGHVEHHKWKKPKIFTSAPQDAEPGEDLADLRWLQYRIPNPAPRSFW